MIASIEKLRQKYKVLRQGWVKLTAKVQTGSVLAPDQEANDNLKLTFSALDTVAIVILTSTIVRGGGGGGGGVTSEDTQLTLPHFHS